MFSFSFFFPQPMNEIMHSIISLHNDIFFFLILIIFLVGWLLSASLFMFSLKNWSIDDTFYVQETLFRRYINLGIFCKEQIEFEDQKNFELELLFSLLPTLLVFAILKQSISVLYFNDFDFSNNNFTNTLENDFCSFNLKIIGHQWYWSYSYNTNMFTDSIEMSYDSYLKEEFDLKIDEFRLLEVIKPLFLPTMMPINILITSDDVIHSWTIPEYGIKIDAIPGRINFIKLIFCFEGHFRGQCSELCGLNHVKMPIVLITMEPTLFTQFIGVTMDKFVGSFEKNLISKESIDPSSSFWHKFVNWFHRK